jgi:NADH-quinone oxidoreductase subunit L
MPITFMTYAVGMMALSGVPLLFSGAWTKEEILHATSHWPASHVPHYLMMAGVVLTAVYMTRQMIYVFGGSRRAGAGEAHESPSVMTIPLIVLAISTVVLGVILTPGWPWLHGYLMGEPAHVDFSRIIQPMLFISFALVAAGIALGWFIYRHTGETDPLAQRQPGVFRFLECKMWLDELYAQTVVAGAHGAARVSDWMDRHFWDRIAGVVGSGGDLAGSLKKGLDERGINAGGDTASTGTRGFGRVISLFHSGQIQTYLAAVAISMLALVFLFAWLR